MTQNQLRYLDMMRQKDYDTKSLEETKRNNLVTASLTLKDLAEKGRHNLVTEAQDLYKTKLDSKTKKQVANKQAKSAKRVAKINARAGKQNAKIGAAATKYAAKSSKSAQKYSADSSRAASKYAADSSAAAQRYKAEVDRAIQAAHDLAANMRDIRDNATKSEIARLESETKSEIARLDRIFNSKNVDANVKAQYAKLKADYKRAMDAKKYDVAAKVLEKMAEAGLAATKAKK